MSNLQKAEQKLKDIQHQIWLSNTYDGGDGSDELVEQAAELQDEVNYLKAQGNFWA